jgi:hypothetical protein
MRIAETIFEMFKFYEIVFVGDHSSEKHSKKLFTGNVTKSLIGLVSLDVVSNCLNKMSFTKANTAIDKERIGR